jgi:SpoVK/Ycf46/Vps4 family AAA+-type ATPase
MQEHTEPVFLVATANDIDALPPELLRKGRFDEIFFVDLPVAEVRREILSIHLRKRGLDPASFDLEKLARESDGFSAAELEEAIVSSMHAALVDKSAGGAGRVTTEMVAAAIRDSPPLSVTAAEKVRALQLWAKTRCVPAD